jgi:hypothetical protein
MNQMTDDMIYLDYNATTPLLPEVVDAMLPFLRDHFGNPSSSHALGRAAREAVAAARARVAALIGSDPQEIVFTSGGTESNNLAIRGVAEARPDRRHIVTSVMEHPAVAAPCAWLERHGWGHARRCGRRRACGSGPDHGSARSGNRARYDHALQQRDGRPAGRPGGDRGRASGSSASSTPTRPNRLARCPSTSACSASTC